MDNQKVLQKDNFSRLLLMVLPDDHDSHHPSKCHELATSLLRYINTKSQRKKRSDEFVKEIRNKIYSLHQYNMVVEKIHNKYPTSRHLDALIVKYVELEFDVLYYGRNNSINQKIETQVLQKVSKFLQIIAHKTQGKNRDDIRSILAILADVKSDYFEKGKFIYTLTSYLLSRFGAKTSTNVPLRDYLKRHFGSNNISTTVNPNDKTSDYESAESDPEHSNQETVSRAASSSTPRVTIELYDDDDDTYMVYLQNPEKTAKNNSNNSSSRQSEVVLLSSDSENESEEPARSNKRKKPVVTFEILDDDEEGNCNSFMVYIGNEVETKNKKPRKETMTGAEIEAVAISDSDEEETIERTKNENSHQIKTELSIGEIAECQEDVMEKDIESEQEIQSIKEEVHEPSQEEILIVSTDVLREEEGGELGENSLDFQENASKSHIKEETEMIKEEVCEPSSQEEILMESTGASREEEGDKSRENLFDLQEDASKSPIEEEIEMIKEEVCELSQERILIESTDVQEEEDSFYSNRESFVESPTIVPVEEKIEVVEEEICDQFQNDVISEYCDPLQENGRSIEDSFISQAESAKSVSSMIMNASSDIFNSNNISGQIPATSTPVSNSPRYAVGDFSTVATFYNMTSYSTVISSPQGFPASFNYLFTHNFFGNIEEVFQNQPSTYMKTTDQVLENSNSLEFPDQKCLLNFGNFGDVDVNEMIDPSLILNRPPAKNVGNEFSESTTDSDGTGIGGIDTTLLVNLLDNTPNPDVLEKYVFGSESDNSMEQLTKIALQTSDFRHSTGNTQENSHR